MQALHSCSGIKLCSGTPVPVRTPVIARAPSARSLSRSTRQHAVRTVAAFSPPTVADTKATFLKTYRKPIPAIYNTVLQELLVQQHFIRYNKNYAYNPIFALGFVSAFDQILDAYPDPSERAKIFESYVAALGEKSAQYRADAEELEKLAGELGGSEGLVPDAGGNKLQQALAAVASASAEGKLSYNKFFAIGLFRLLELTGAKEPAALEKLVKAVGVKPESVNKDLMLYKGVLSKLSVAKELMREFLEREKRKQGERDEAKSAKETASQTA